MATLKLEPNIPQPDDFYAALMVAHRDLEPLQSHKLNAKLVLLLANHIGDLAVLQQALNIARDGIGEPLSKA